MDFTDFNQSTNSNQELATQLERLCLRENNIKAAEARDDLRKLIALNKKASQILSELEELKRDRDALLEQDLTAQQLEQDMICYDFVIKEYDQKYEELYPEIMEMEAAVAKRYRQSNIAYH